ncbi:MAG: hypothetical protein AAGA80_03370, partial [Cyanobacteria bacterium P01_F01_bin.143]
MLNNQNYKLVEQIEELSKANYTGTIKITRAQSKALKTVNIGPKISFLVFAQGIIVYADDAENSPQCLAKKIGQKFKINLIDRALITVKDKVKNENSFHEIFDLLARFGLVKSEELAEYIHNNIIITLEEIGDNLGNLEEYTDFNFDLNQEGLGLSWQEIKSRI